MHKIYLPFTFINKNGSDVVEWLQAHAGFEYMPQSYGLNVQSFKRSKGKWCKIYIRSEDYNQSGYEYCFKDAQIAMLFKLTWGGNV